VSQNTEVKRRILPEKIAMNANNLYLIFLKLVSFCKTKFFIAVAGLGWVLSFLMPVRNYLIFMTFLIIADTISGIKAARKRREKITSRGFRRAVDKFVVYFLSILAGYGMELCFGHTGLAWMPVIPFTVMCSLSIIGTEFLSMRENVFTLTNTDILAGLAKKLPIFMDAVPNLPPYQPEPSEPEEDATHSNTQ
jgi:phage-related holin